MKFRLEVEKKAKEDVIRKVKEEKVHELILRAQEKAHAEKLAAEAKARAAKIAAELEAKKKKLAEIAK